MNSASELLILRKFKKLIKMARETIEMRIEKDYKFLRRFKNTKPIIRVEKDSSGVVYYRESKTGRYVSKTNASRRLKKQADGKLGEALFSAFEIVVTGKTSLAERAGIL